VEEDSLSPEVIQALLDLQELDLKLLEFEEHQKNLPALIEEIEAPVRAAREEAERIEAELAEAQNQHRYYERELDASNEKFKKLQTQQMNVRNAVEYNAFMHEMEALRERADNLEESGLRWLERGDVARERLPEVKSQLEQETSTATAARERLDGKTAELKRIHDEAAELQAPLVKRIPPNVLSYYKRLRRAGKAPFVAPVNRGACGGCGFRHPPQRLQEIKKSDRLIPCEQCGRIQVWREQEEEQIGF
jgi:predicted  nucleic acid-binding Zn-ribbon protein